jgi:hypothetical protein
LLPSHGILNWVIMPTIKTCLIPVLLGCFFTSCVERYYLEEESIPTSRIVVEALITDHDTLQKVVLSKTSSPENPSHFPLTHCMVSIMDTNNNEFVFKEVSGSPGTYQGIIDSSHLRTGNRFRLGFILPTGEQYISDYEELIECPPVDSVYYEISAQPTIDPDVDILGLQFYMDLNASETDGRYYRLQIDETWEYHATWPINLYWAGRIVSVTEDYSRYYCYRTMPVDQIFILTTASFAENRYKGYTLHFVDNLTQKLMHKYSLLIKQYSMSEGAYYFWSNLKKNNQESGGLFDSQPALVRANVRNIDNAGEIVLGYFGVSSVKTRRIILSDIEGLSFEVDPLCTPREVNLGMVNWLPEEWPVYLIIYYDHFSGTNVLGMAGRECFDCTLLGGTTEKPVYWDEK